MAIGIPSNPRDDEVDMAPMIDMVFLLLVFFMVSSHLQSEEFIELNVPKATAAKIPEDRSDRLVVSVMEDGTLYLGAREILEEDLAVVLQQRNEEFIAATNGYQRQKLYLRGDGDADHGEVRKVMRLAAEAGIMDIIFATYEDVD